MGIFSMQDASEYRTTIDTTYDAARKATTSVGISATFLSRSAAIEFEKAVRELLDRKT